jgi:hypothetical protein
MTHNKIHGPDGLRAEFYQKIWDFVGPGLMNAFMED